MNVSKIESNARKILEQHCKQHPECEFDLMCCREGNMSFREMCTKLGLDPMKTLINDQQITVCSIPQTTTAEVLDSSLPSHQLKWRSRMGIASLKFARTSPVRIPSFEEHVLNSIGGKSFTDRNPALKGLLAKFARFADPQTEHPFEQLFDANAGQENLSLCQKIVVDCKKSFVELLTARHSTQMQIDIEEIANITENTEVIKANEETRILQSSEPSEGDQQSVPKTMPLSLPILKPVSHSALKDSIQIMNRQLADSILSFDKSMPRTMDSEFGNQLLSENSPGAKFSSVTASLSSKSSIEAVNHVQSTNIIRETLNTSTFSKQIEPITRADTLGNNAELDIELDEHLTQQKISAAPIQADGAIPFGNKTFPALRSSTLVPETGKQSEIKPNIPEIQDLQPTAEPLIHHVKSMKFPTFKKSFKPQRLLNHHKPNDAFADGEGFVSLLSPDAKNQLPIIDSRSKITNDEFTMNEGYIPFSHIGDNRRSPSPGESSKGRTASNSSLDFVSPATKRRRASDDLSGNTWPSLHSQETADEPAVQMGLVDKRIDSQRFQSPANHAPPVPFVHQAARLKFIQSKKTVPDLLTPVDPRARPEDTAVTPNVMSVPKIIKPLNHQRAILPQLPPNGFQILPRLLP